MSLVAVGFDLDYTLCLPARDRATLLEEAVAEAGAAPTAEWASRSAYRAAHGAHLTRDTREPIFAAMLDDEADDADPARLARAYRERVNGALQPVAGLERLLAELHGQYRVGLLTNGPSRAQRTKLHTLELTDAFDAVCISGELPAGKPDARAFGALLDELDADPAELVYVGDSVDADVGGATAAGCRAVQVLRDDGPDPDPRADDHVHVEALADELPGVIETLG